jgi:hypothetical protein
MGLPCRKCQGTGVVHSEEYASVIQVVREEIQEYCKQTFTGFLTDYVDKKKAE